MCAPEKEVDLDKPNGHHHTVLHRPDLSFAITTHQDFDLSHEVLWLEVNSR